VAWRDLGDRQGNSAAARGRLPGGGEVASGDKGKGRKLTLPDGVFDRLVFTAIKRGSTASAVAAEILDRNLPRLRIATDD
jgi:hypothetical protein